MDPRHGSLIAPAGRLVNVSSSGHRYSDVDLDDPNFERTPLSRSRETSSAVKKFVEIACRDSKTRQ